MVLWVKGLETLIILYFVLLSFTQWQLGGGGWPGVSWGYGLPHSFGILTESGY